jgi:hypothetical protein
MPFDRRGQQLALRVDIQPDLQEILKRRTKDEIFM